MKIVIWLISIGVAAAIQTAFRMNGILLGGIPTMILYGAAIAASIAICKVRDRIKSASVPDEAKPEERWYTCSKCGSLVREGEPCDCEKVQVKAVAPKKICATPFVKAQEKLDRDFAAGNVTQEEYSKRTAELGVADLMNPAPEQKETTTKRASVKSKLPIILSALCVVLVLCSCILGYKAYVFSEMAEKLTSENKILDATLSDLSDENRDLTEKLSTMQETKEPSFSSYAEWKSLHDGGYITLSYDEWLVLLG